MRAIVTVGLGFGDEGKGATVDFLARELAADLVVRYSGGAQAGHNVELPRGQRHTFAQFGAGTLARVKTFLGPRMIVCPATMVPEAEHLMELGVNDPWSLLTAHPECLVATGYHQLMNRLREAARGDQRHGSCGLGIGETRHYWIRYGEDAVFVRDLDDRRILLRKLTLMRERFLLELQQLPNLPSKYTADLHATLPGSEANSLQVASEDLQVKSRVPDFKTAIFEAAQGVLLDEWFGFHPYTTWSTVTPLHAIELLAEVGCTDYQILGITRAYATRHGAGPFPTFSAEMSQQMQDRGNPHNDWQGAIRFGPLDLVLLEYAARVSKIDGLFVNGLDQLPETSQVCTHYQTLNAITPPHSLREQELLTQTLNDVTPVYQSTSTEGMVSMLEKLAPVVGVAEGPTHQDRQILGKLLLGS